MAQVIDSFRTYFEPATTTEREVAGYVSEQDMDRVLSQLQESRYSDLGQVCYVFGGGHQPRSCYDDLKAKVGIRVVHYETTVPWVLRFIPGYRGLVKIEEPSMLRSVFDRLTDQSRAICLIFNAEIEAAVVDSVRSIDRHGDHSFGIKSDPGYLIYFVDADRDDSPTAMVQFLSYGSAGPWKTLFQDM